MRKHYKAIIADDEEPLRAHLRHLLSSLWPELLLRGEAANGLEAMRLLAEEQPDVAFLDIRMPGLSGLRVASHAPPHCAVVFVTAFDEYAVTAFEQAALDYLLKPVTVERLARTIARMKAREDPDRHAPRDLARELDQVLKAVGGPRRYLQWIKAQEGENITLIPVDEVCFFQAHDKYTTVMTATRELLIRTSIKQLASGLDPEKFWLIHRKTIVNARQISHVGRSLTGRHVVHLRDRPEFLTVSRAFGFLFKQM